MRKESGSLRQFHNCGEREIPVAVDWQSRGDDFGCRTLDLHHADMTNGSSIIEGIGYDGYILQLGDPAADSKESISEAILKIEDLAGDSIKLQIFHLPYFPMYDGKGCRIGVSIDDSEEEIIEYLPEEWSKPWKLNILISQCSFCFRKCRVRFKSGCDWFNNCCMVA